MTHGCVLSSPCQPKALGWEGSTGQLEGGGRWNGEQGLWTDRTGDGVGEPGLAKIAWHTRAAWICASYFAGTVQSSPIGMAARQPGI